MAVTKALFAGDDPTPDSVKRRRMMADMLLAQGQDIRHVDSPLEAIGSLLQSGVGAYQSRKADQEDKAGLASRREGQNMLLDSAFGDGAGFGSATGPIGSSSETPQGRVAAASIPAGERASYIRSGLIQRGLPEHVADGFLVNFQDESGLDPGVNEKAPLVPGSRGGFGLYQLTGPRRRDYEAFASQRGVDPSDVDAQMDFLVGEMGVGNAGSQNAPWWGSERAAAKSILAAPDTSTAAQAIVNNFLRPAPEHRASRTRRYAGLGGSAAPVQVASLDPSAGVAEATAPQASSVPLDTRAVVERAMADQTARAGGPVAEFGAQDVTALQARPRDPQAVPYAGPGATIDARDVPALTPGNRLGDTLSPEDQAIYDERIRGRGPQPNSQPYTGPGARARDADGMTSIAPVGLPGSSAAANAGIEAFHAGNGSTPTQYGQGAPGAVPPSPTSDLRGVLTQAVEAQEQAAIQTPTPRPQAAQSMAGAPSTALVPGGDGKGPVDPAALSNSPLVRGGALPSSADPMLGGNEGALAMARQSQSGAAAGGTTTPAQPQASANGYATELPSPPPAPIQNDQQRAALAGVLTGGQGQAPGGLPYNRAMIAQLLANPWTEDLGQQALQEVLKFQGQATQRQYDAMTLREQRAYDEQVRQQGFQREDARFAVEDRREDARLGLDVRRFEREGSQPINVSGTLVDPQTLQPVFTAPEKPTGNMQEYDAYAADERAAGRQPIGRLEYEQTVRRSGTNNTTINTGSGNGTKFNEKTEEAAAKRLDDIVQAGGAAAQTLGDVQQLADLGRQIGTGLGAQVMTRLGPYAEALGINVEGLAPAQAYQSIVARMAPQMRPAGSGASSDFDARQFLQSLPSLGNTPEGNQIITDTFAAVQQNKLQAAEIASQAYLPADQGGITWQEAERRIRSLPNPYERFKATQAKAGSPPAPQDTTRRQDGVPVGGSGETPIERARNPKTGQVLELRNGQWVEVQ